jgi:hypothetical protein
MIGLASTSEYSCTRNMNDSSYRKLFEEMEDINIKWLSAIFFEETLWKRWSFGHLLRNTIQYPLIQAHAQKINTNP